MNHTQIGNRVLALFSRILGSGGQRSNNTDDTMIAKTSPTVWQYEMFRIEWTRRSTLRMLYEMVREDPRMMRANRVFASTAVRRGFQVRLSSTAMSTGKVAQAQNIIDDFNRRTGINTKLTPWARVLLRDGDLFLNPVLDVASQQIIRVKSLPALTMQRNEDITGNFPDLESAFQQIDPISLQPELELALWQVNHVRWDHEEGERYGRSQYLSGLAKWRQINMMEQDLVIRRRTRAAPKRLHNVGTPERPGGKTELDNYMETNKLRGGPNEIVTDYFGNGLISITDLSPDEQLGQIQDIVHQQEVYMMTTGVPLAVMGFGQNINRDVLEDQRAQFQQDAQELRALLENGDGGANSGIRALWDLELALHGMDPGLLDYNVIWYENDDETANDRIDRVVALRAAEPDPLVSRRTALRIIAEDIGLDGEDSIEKEIDEIKAEQAEDFKEQSVEETALNPMKPAPAPLSKGITAGAAKGAIAQDAVGLTPDGETHEDEGVTGDLGGVYTHATGNNPSFPLHNNPFLDEMEQHIRDNIKSLFGQVAEQAAQKHRKAVARLADMQPTAKTGMLDTLQMDLDPYTIWLMTGAYPHRHTVTDAQQKDDEPSPTMPVATVIYPLLDQFEHEMGPATEAFAQLLKQVYLKVGGNVFNQVHDQQGDSERLDGHKHNPLAIKDSEVQRTLAQIAGQRAKGIVKTTRKVLAQQLSEAYENGEPLEQWINRIQQTIAMPDWRAQMIARSEVANAHAVNLLNAYQDLGVQQVKWHAVVDDRTCPTCRFNNGQTFSLSAMPSLPAHPNCRCTVTAVRGS